MGKEVYSIIQLPLERGATDQELPQTFHPPNVVGNTEVPVVPNPVPFVNITQGHKCIQLYFFNLSNYFSLTISNPCNVLLQRLTGV